MIEELSTVAMFGGGRRLVVVEEADDFVSQYRPQLEDYVARPARSGVLVLDLKTFPSNTRLYKAVAADGLAVDCGAPPARRWCVGSSPGPSRSTRPNCRSRRPRCSSR